MSSTEHSTIFEAAAAVSSAVKSLPRTAAKSSGTLSPAAIEVADEEFKPAYSPIVLAGTVRLIEAALVISVVVLKERSSIWRYVAGAIIAAGVLILRLG